MAKSLRYTAVGSIAIADNLTNLLTSHYITSDVHEASHLYPTAFSFDPIKDAGFISEQTYRSPYEDLIAMAETVLKKFDRWYNSAGLMDRAFLAVNALTNTSDNIDYLVTDLFDELRSKHRMTCVDSDDSLFYAENYQAIRDERNIDAIINTPHVDWFCRRLEDQARRIIASPCVPFRELQDWVAEKKKIQYEQERNMRHSLFETKHDKKNERRVFNRSLRIFERFFGVTAARKFVGGKNLWIRGHHFVWKLKLKNLPYDSLMNLTHNPSNSHVPYQLTICDHEAIELASGCVLFKETPILDQAVMLGLSIRASSEDELELLKETNIFAFTPAGMESNLLTSMPKANPLSNAAAAFLTDDCDESNDWRDRYQRYQIILDDPTIDDGPLDDEEEECNDNDNSDEPDNEEEECNDNDNSDEPDNVVTPTILLDPADPFMTCFESESTLRTTIPDMILAAYAGNGVTEDQRESLFNLYTEWHMSSYISRQRRGVNQVWRRIFDKIISKLDIDPAIANYMCFPEFHYHYFPRITHAPRLEAYVVAKVPLLENQF